MLTDLSSSHHEDSDSSIQAPHSPGSGGDHAPRAAAPMVHPPLPVFGGSADGASSGGGLHDASLAEAGAAAAALGLVPPEKLRELLKEEDVKKSRLARKAELARLSRRRKKMRLGDLEEQVAALEAELETAVKQRHAAEDALAAVDLRAAAERPPEAFATEEVQTSEIKRLYALMRTQIEAAGRSGGAAAAATAMEGTAAAAAAAGGEGELQQTVLDLLACYARRDARGAEQVQRLRAQLATPLPLHFLAWAAAQGERFLADPAGLWSCLCLREVGLSPAQLARLQTSLLPAVARHAAAAERMASAVGELAAATAESQAGAQRVMAELAAGMAPEQLARFLAWINTYGQVVVRIR